ncbi:MAG: hypothetical protein IJC54_00355, partial [Clostridia bacterium]|nr:hypothetical protein [Clostridia bacterium]
RGLSLGKESPHPRPPQINQFGEGDFAKDRKNERVEPAIRLDWRKQLSAGTARSLGKEKELPRTPSKKKPDGERRSTKD